MVIYYTFETLFKVKYSDPIYHKGDFLLLNRAEWEQLHAAGWQFSHLLPDYEDANYIIIRYPPPEIFLRENPAMR